MPKRYAYNTSATQVKKRYAMIGSTATQVKKRYAMIGSTATLVYSAEEQLFPDNLTFTKGGTNADCSITSSTLNVYATSNHTNSAISAQYDVTDVSKIIFTVSDIYKSSASNGSLSVGVSDRQYPSTTGSYSDNNGVGVAVTATGTVEVDVSNLSGVKYAAISAWASVGNCNMTVTKIVAE